MTDCIFCKIAAGDIPVDFIYKDEDVVAFPDMSPQAPTHILVIPRKHISTLNEAGDEDTERLGKLLRAASTIAQQQGFAEEGYRSVLNCNELAGQTVFHVHLHLLAGRAMHWPPG